MSTDQPSPRIVFVTGPAGAGRQTCLRALEDLGFEAIDNVPLRLVGALMKDPGDGLGTALGIDPRNREFSTNTVLDLLNAAPDASRASVELLYLDCATPVLLNRFSETRRRHPLAGDVPVEAAIEAEKSLLAPLRARAGVLIDTSELNVHDLRASVDAWFSPGVSRTINVSVQSFSYKRGVPRSVDMVFDCRFLSNPYWVPDLRAMSGVDQAVQDYVCADDKFADFARRTDDLVLSLLPAFADEGKSHLTVAFGCTGGQHRSVTVAERHAAALADAGWQVSIKHRDLDRRKWDEAAA